MDPRALLPLLAQVGIVAALMWLGTLIWRNRVRARNAPLRSEIEAQVRFATALDRASVLGTGWVGIRGRWFPLQGPKRLIVGADAFIFSRAPGPSASLYSRAPNALSHSARRHPAS
jgi:hypothetical protein